MTETTTSLSQTCTLILGMALSYFLWSTFPQWELTRQSLMMTSDFILFYYEAGPRTCVSHLGPGNRRLTKCRRNRDGKLLLQGPFYHEPIAIKLLLYSSMDRFKSIINRCIALELMSLCAVSGIFLHLF